MRISKRYYWTRGPAPQASLRRLGDARRRRVLGWRYSSLSEADPAHRGYLENLMRSQGMTQDENYRELLTRLSTALAIAEAAYVEAKRRRNG